MEALWVSAAFLLGFAAFRLGFPPLVGYLGAGLALSGLGFRSTAFLHQAAEIGVLLLLFSVGLKLRFQDLAEPRVLALGGGVLLLSAFLLYPIWESLPLAIALGFSSTVLVAKILEDKKEIGSFHGRLALGVLILQDVAAVGLMSLYGSQSPSPWTALVVLLFPLLRRGVAWLVERSGHEELLLLMGLALALGGGEVFHALGLSRELGALLMGMLLSGHVQSTEVGRTLWSLKEAFLVAFFLDIGLREGLEGVDWGVLPLLALWAMAKAPLYFFASLLLGLRARTGFLAGVYLGNHSEFALIVGAVLAGSGHLPLSLSTLTLGVVLSMALSAPLARTSHTLYRRLEAYLLRLERPVPHPEAEPQSLGEGTVLVVGMGRTGEAVYRMLEARGEKPVGLDSDPERVERERKRGLQVVYGDAEDPELWQRLDLKNLKGIVLAVPDLEAKLLAARWLKEKGYGGLLAATSFHAEEDPALKAAGVDLLYHPFQEGGERLAEKVLEEMAIMGGEEYGRSQQMGPDQAQKGRERPQEG